MDKKTGAGMASAKVEIIVPAMAETCMTKKEIAEKAGVGANAVYRIAKGYWVRPDILGKVCKTLGLKVADVMILHGRNDNVKSV